MIKKSPNKFWTKEKVLKAIEARLKNGKSMDPGRLKKDFPSLYDACCNYFGGYRDALKEAGIEYDDVAGERGSRRKNSYGIDFKREKRMFEMWQSGMTLEEIARKENMSTARAAQIVRRNGCRKIRRRVQESKKRVFIELCNRFGGFQVLRECIAEIEQGRPTYGEMAADLGIKPEDVGYVLKRLEIPRHRGGVISPWKDLLEEAAGTSGVEAWLERKYRNMTAREIAEEAGVPLNYVKKRIHSYGIRKSDG